MLTIEKILADLEKYCEFPNPETATEDDIIHEENYNDLLAPLYDSCAFLGEPWQARAGVTKVCLIFDNLPFVIKIPFMGSYGYDYEEGTTRIRTGCSLIPPSQRTSYDYVRPYTRVDFNTFFGTAFEDYTDWDYCDHEAYISDMAQEAGVGKFFATERCIGYINGYPIYMQEKAEVYSSSGRSLNKSSKETYDKLHTIIDKESPDNYALYDLCDNEEWLAQALVYYGEEQFKNFLDFLATYEINDLHGSNIGYIGDRPVLLDYSGYEG